MQRIPWHHTTQKLAIGRYTAGTLALSLIRWVLQTQLVSSALPILNSSEVGDHQHSEKKTPLSCYMHCNANSFGQCILTAAHTIHCIT